VIAQDVQAVLPEAITVRDGILGVKYTEIIPLLIEAINDIRTRLLQFEQTSLCAKCSDFPFCARNLGE